MKISLGKLFSFFEFCCTRKNPKSKKGGNLFLNKKETKCLNLQQAQKNEKNKKRKNLRKVKFTRKFTYKWKGKKKYMQIQSLLVNLATIYLLFPISSFCHSKEESVLPISSRYNSIFVLYWLLVIFFCCACFRVSS